MVFGEKEKRCLLPREHLCVQGMPAYLYDHPYFHGSSIKWLLGSGNRRHLTTLKDSGDDVSCQLAQSNPIASTAIRGIAGNMMSMQQVGTIMLWVLLTTGPNEELA